jgi:hypothetical protein
MIQAHRYHKTWLDRDKANNRKDLATVLRWLRGCYSHKSVTKIYVGIVHAFVFGILAGQHNAENQFKEK